ncbi:MAG: hypothetical protein AAFY70_01815 [Bacteroidota bacterium]
MADRQRPAIEQAEAAGVMACAESAIPTRVGVGGSWRGARASGLVGNDLRGGRMDGIEPPCTSGKLAFGHPTETAWLLSDAGSFLRREAA